MPAPVTALPLPACGVRGAHLDGECGSSGRARRRRTALQHVALHLAREARFGNGQGTCTTTGCAASCCLRPRASTCGRRAAAASGVLRRVLRRGAGSCISLPNPLPARSSHATRPPHPRPALQAPAGPNYHGGGRLNELATLPGSTAPSTLPNSTLLRLNPKPNPNPNPTTRLTQSLTMMLRRTARGDPRHIVSFACEGATRLEFFRNDYLLYSQSDDRR